MVRHKRSVVTPFLCECDAGNFTPDVRAGVIEDDHLKSAPSSDDLIADSLKHRPHCRDVLVACTPRLRFLINLETAWEVNLAGLVIDQEAGDAVVWLFNEKTLQR